MSWCKQLLRLYVHSSATHCSCISAPCVLTLDHVKFLLATKQQQLPQWAIIATSQLQPKHTVKQYWHVLTSDHSAHSVFSGRVIARSNNYHSGIIVCCIRIWTVTGVDALAGFENPEYHPDKGSVHLNYITRFANRGYHSCKYHKCSLKHRVHTAKMRQ